MHFLDEIIAVENRKMCAKAELKPKEGKRLAELKVLRKVLLKEKLVIKQRGFKNDREVLAYSFDLFKDKLNSNTTILNDPNDPRAIANLRKFNEY